MVVRIDEREVVRTHLRKSVSVFIDERSLEDGVSSSERIERNDGVTSSISLNTRGRSRIVGPFRLASGVADSKEESLDGVGETDVKRLSSVSGGGERLSGGSLNLLNEDITRSTSHTLSFVIGNDGVVSPNLARTKGRNTSNKLRTIGRKLDTVGISIISGKNEKRSPVTESEVDSHFIVGESSGG